jgi:hypothetical protein
MSKPIEHAEFMMTHDVVPDWCPRLEKWVEPDRVDGSAVLVL